MLKKYLFVLLSLLATSAGFAQEKLSFANVQCAGDYQHHLQGVCTDSSDAIYWSFTTELVKTNRRGQVLKKIPVANHHGDLCFHHGELYVAVILGKFNDPKGNADSWVYVYDADTLKVTAKHETQEVFHGAGGIGVMNGGFYVVGGLPDGVPENYVYQYDAKFRFLRKHVIKSDWTRLGIQTATYHDDAWWFGCYGSPAILLKTDDKFKMLGRYEFDCSLGIVGVAKDRLLVAKGPRTEQGRCLGSLHLAHPDKKRGLMLMPKTSLATDKQNIKQQGSWSEERFRYAAFASARTTEEKASLEYPFDGTGVSVRLGGHNTPPYGRPNLGSLAVFVDGKQTQMLHPRSLPREIVLAQGVKPGPHTARLEHHVNAEGTDAGDAGIRVESFTAWNDARGDLQFQINGEADAHLIDCRAILRRGETVIRNSLVRNWLTGQCSLTGLPPGDDYSLEIRTVGWQTVRTEPFRIDAQKSTKLPPIYLKRDASTVTSRFRFPRLNKPTIRKPGEKLRVRFLGYQTTIDEVKLIRRLALQSRAGYASKGLALQGRAGHARKNSALESQATTISRVIDWQEDKSAAHYYDREVVATLPNDMPPGIYDLQVKITGGRRTGFCRSPRSVHVVSAYPDPANLTLVTFGHLDTSAQHQAEYLQRLVTMVNLLAPDMVLCSNACNPAYVSGALARLDMPYVINFGNHQFSGHEAWYGDPVGLIDLGPDISILNYGFPWYADKAKPQANALLASRPHAATKIINAFEANAPLELLDRHRIRMIHDAHGIGKKVTDFGTTPTRRIGKINAESFRVVRLRNGEVISCTYNGHETAPIPFGRESISPVSISFQRPNDGTQSNNTAIITNHLEDAYPNGRVTFIAPAGKYKIHGGRMESQIASDDHRFHLLNIRVNIPANGSADVTLKRI